MSAIFGAVINFGRPLDQNTSIKRPSRKTIGQSVKVKNNLGGRQMKISVNNFPPRPVLIDAGAEYIKIYYIHTRYVHTEWL